MADLIRILFLVPIGYIAAVLTAAVTILAGWYGHDAGAISSDAIQTGAVIGLGLWLVLEIGALSVIPGFLAIVVAELFGWRSVFFYLAVGGALGLLAWQFPGAVWEGEGSQLLLPAAGFVGSLAYWLIAGRFAGIGRQSVPPPAAPANPPPPPASPPPATPTSPA
jgi:hypothetical protein